MHPKTREKIVLTIVGWFAAGVIFFPIFWMILTSFKTEVEAIATPPKFFFTPTLENYVTVRERADYIHFALNSMLSTKMMPAVGVLIPIYLLFRDVGAIDTRWGLTIVYTLMNLPIVVWMLYTFFKEVPKDILEAGRMDGAKPKQEVWMLLLPLSLPGIASTALLSIILCWNEAFWSLNLTTSNAAPLTTFIASFSAPEGLFWAKLSAASTIAIAPILVFGWMSQRQLVRGLTFGAVK
jgi:sorbitol/mannitol transport system permease protein